MDRNLSMNDLPNEVLTNVFKCLDCLQKLNCRLVCKRWKEILSFYLLKQKTLGIALRLNEDSANFQNIYEAQWECSSVEHHSKDDHIICLKKSEFLQSIKKRPYIESLDLRGSTIDFEIVSAIHQYCHNLICLHLDSITVAELRVWDRLVLDIMPKIKHLSIDNRYTVKDWPHPNHFQNNTNDFFREAQNLEEIELNIYPGESLFNYDSLAQLATKISFASINIRIKKENLETEKLILLDVIINLLKGNAKYLEFLRLSTNENYINIMGVFTRIAKFVKLQALNLSCKNYHRQDYHKIAELTQITSLTMDLNVGEDLDDDYDEPDQIMAILFNSKFSHTIKRLRLVNGEITANIFEGIARCYKNLENLQLVDMKFKNIQLCLKRISCIQQLESLHIEYTFKKDAEPEDLENLKSLHEFQLEFFPLIKNIIDKCENLKEFSIIEWPHFGLNELTELQMIAQQKSIDFKYRVF